MILYREAPEHSSQQKKKFFLSDFFKIYFLFCDG